MAERQQRAYLAGPMRGLPNHNHAAFDTAEAQLREAGYDVFSPAAYDRQAGHDPATERTQKEIRQLLGVDLYWICHFADVVVVLPGWYLSRGAKAEVAAARALDLPVWPLDIALHQARRNAGTTSQHLGRCERDA